jgi:hypothetical protein
VGCGEGALAHRALPGGGLGCQAVGRWASSDGQLPPQRCRRRGSAGGGQRCLAGGRASAAHSFGERRPCPAVPWRHDEEETPRDPPRSMPPCPAPPGRGPSPRPCRTLPPEGPIYCCIPSLQSLAATGALTDPVGQNPNACARPHGARAKRRRCCSLVQPAPIDPYLI